MIQLRVIQYLQNGMNGTRLRIVRPINQTLNAGMNERARAHGTRFNCSKKCTVAQTVVTDVSAGIPQRDDLCVGRGITVRNVAIPSPADYLSVTADHRSNWPISHFQGTLGAQ